MPPTLSARRLAEVRARLAHRAAGSVRLVACSVDPGDALPAGAARAEVYRGQESAARRVIEVAGPIVTRAASWADLHAALVEHGIAYTAKGSGAVFVVDGIVLKASTCRAASRARLEARLGPFQPGPGGDAPPLDSDRQPARITPSPRPAPGIDPELFAVARQAEIAARADRDAYDGLYPDLNVAPLLKTLIVGPAPRAAPSARSLARRTGMSLPRLAKLRQPERSGANLSGLLALYHDGLQADRYRIVAERAGSQQLDRLVQLTPRPMTGIAAGWAALERACGRYSAVYLKPISDKRHHVVLSGLSNEDFGRLRATGFAPALVLDTRGGRHEVVLSAPDQNRPYEQAALAEAREHLRLSLGLGRSRFGLRIDDHDPLPPPAAASDEPAHRIYAQVLSAPGATCERLGRLILAWIRVFARRFGLGPGSRLGRGFDPDGVAPHADAPLYWAHRADLLARWQGRWPDSSRIDALIARRLRGTGHGEAAVAALITACASGTPRVGSQVWADYGRRAAAHAFRTDTDDSAWAFDRVSPEMWSELEQAVRVRAKAQTPEPVTVPPPPLPQLQEPAQPPGKDKTAPGTTRRAGRRGRDDTDGPGDR